MERKTYTYEYPRPAVTADTVLLAYPENPQEPLDAEVLLVRRGRDPYKGKWALPGGFLDMEETVEACARRELREETGAETDAFDFILLGLYDRPDRDPRGRTVSAAYLVQAPRDAFDPAAGDDAAEARFFPARALPPADELAYDHADILGDALSLVERVAGVHGDGCGGGGHHGDGECGCGGHGRHHRHDGHDCQCGHHHHD